MEEFERIKKLVEKSNKYCLYVELEDIKTLIRIIETMNKTAKLKNESRKHEKLISITPEELAEALENLIKDYKEKEEIVKQLDQQIFEFSNEVVRDFIPKSKIREKIEETKNEVDKATKDFTDNNGSYADYTYYFGKLEAFEELKKEGEN